MNIPSVRAGYFSLNFAYGLSQRGDNGRDRSGSFNPAVFFRPAISKLFLPGQRLIFNTPSLFVQYFAQNDKLSFLCFSAGDGNVKMNNGFSIPLFRDGDKGIPGL
jgi:hypothetical protein